MSDPITRLNAALAGRYAIERELGEGGMATVYLADDLKHERKVALKVLKPELAAVVGAERFLAEIKTTANLTHPHILPLFDSGEADGFVFYVMPPIEGESLRERIDREKQLPVDEAVKIATDLAEALDYAHRQGVIHRDIKPANVLLLEGKPVISDFGIALAISASGAGERLTETGLSLGTPYYMSPEQATGDQAVGASTDTYALGCVLYEMLVGDPPFAGSTAQAVLGKIIAGKHISATEERPSVPANVDGAIRKALEKLPADRFASASDFARALGDEHFRYGEPATEGAGLAVSPWNRLTTAFAALAAVLTLTLGWSALRPAPPEQVARFLALEGFDGFQTPALLPDGSGMVFRQVDDGVPSLWLRRWDNLNPSRIAGTEGATLFHGPELSPDGLEVAFIANLTQLKVAPLSGGVVRTLSNDGSCCLRWGSDGFIYYQSQPGNINRVRAEGGAVEPVTQRDGDFPATHTDFQVLPDSDLGVFMVGGPTRIVAQRLSTGERKVLVPGMRPFVTRTGHLVFASLEGQILAANFDAEAMELTSPPTPLVEGVMIKPNSYPLFTVSESGDLLYVTGTGNVGSERSLVWVDRDGREEPIAAPPNDYSYPRISPDGRRVALDTRGEDGGIWIWNFDGATLMRLILGDGRYQYPVWTPNGERIAYGSPPSRDIYWKAWNNPGVPDMLAEVSGSEGRGGLSPYFFTLDGAALVFRDQETPETNDDLIMISIGGDSILWRLNGDFIERNAELSPDGRWMAYQSDESDAFEIYVRPFPQVEDDQVLVSNNGGRFPLWSRDGSELFYLQPGSPYELIAVSLDTDETDRSFAFSDREVVIEWPYVVLLGEGRSYDVSDDGQRFLAITTGATAGEGETTGQAILVQNWFEELKERVPPSRATPPQYWVLWGLGLVFLLWGSQRVGRYWYKNFGKALALE